MSWMRVRHSQRGASGWAAAALLALASGCAGPDGTAGSGTDAEADATSTDHDLASVHDVETAPDAASGQDAESDSDADAPACLGDFDCPSSPDACFVGRCEPKGCVVVPAPDAPCEDGVACTLGDRCQAGICKRQA